MRRRYLVAYDISEPKRLRRMFKTMRGYGDPVQYSVFLCDLTPQERVLMLEALTRVYHAAEDRFFVVDLGPVRSLAKDRMEFFGRKPEELPETGAVVV